MLSISRYALRMAVEINAKFDFVYGNDFFCALTFHTSQSIRFFYGAVFVIAISWLRDSAGGWAWVNEILSENPLYKRTDVPKWAIFSRSFSFMFLLLMSHPPAMVVVFFSLVFACFLIIFSDQCIFNFCSKSCSFFRANSDTIKYNFQHNILYLL